MRARVARPGENVNDNPVIMVARKKLAGDKNEPWLRTHNLITGPCSRQAPELGSEWFGVEFYNWAGCAEFGSRGVSAFDYRTRAFWG